MVSSAGHRSDVRISPLSCIGSPQSGLEPPEVLSPLYSARAKRHCTTDRSRKMCLQNRQTVRCHRCRVVIKTNLILDQVCDRVQGPHLQCDSVETRETVVDYSQCNKCLGSNGRSSVPSASNANLQGRPSRYGNRTLSNSRFLLDMNNAGSFTPPDGRRHQNTPSGSSFLSRTGDLTSSDRKAPASHGQYRATPSEPINPRPHGELDTMPFRVSFKNLPQPNVPESVVASVAQDPPRGLASQIRPQDNEGKYAYTPSSKETGNIQRMTGFQSTATDEIFGQHDELHEQDARLLKMVADLDFDDGEEEDDDISIKDENMGRSQPDTNESWDRQISPESQGGSGMIDPADGNGIQGNNRRRTRRGTRAGRHVRARREYPEAHYQHHQFRKSGLSAVANEFRPAYPPTGPRYQTQGPNIARPNGPGRRAPWGPF